MPEHDWILDVPEYVWKYLNKLFWLFMSGLIILNIWPGSAYASDMKYAKVLNMLQYSSYGNIIIVVTNVIILELSARFAHPGAP